MHIIQPLPAAVIDSLNGCFFVLIYIFRYATFVKFVSLETTLICNDYGSLPLQQHETLSSIHLYVQMICLGRYIGACFAVSSYLVCMTCKMQRSME